MATIDRRKRYLELRQSKEINRWYNQIGKRITAEVYLRRLGSFCNAMNTDPFKLIKMNEKKLKDTVMDYIEMLENEGKAGSYIKSIIKGVKSWLSFNGITIKTKIKIRNTEDTPTLDDKAVPLQEELKRILASADIRGRAMIGLIAFSGIRLGSIGTHRGRIDALRLKDIPELEISNNKASFTKIPAVIRVRKEISKTGKEYITFLGDEGCMYLENYFSERVSEGEELNANSPVITPSKRGIRGDNPFISAGKIGDMIRRSIRIAGLNNRPYDLRAYFDSRLLLAQDERLIIRDYRQYFMGHKGDIEFSYTLNRKKDQETLERMRDAYKRSLKFLQTEQRGLSEDEALSLERKLTMRTLQMMGFDMKDAEELSSLSDEELQKKIKEKLGMKILNGNTQKVIPLGEVESYIMKGFEFVSALPGDKAIIKLPK
jgi:integrase